jgi:hypothetical protein
MDNVATANHVVIADRGPYPFGDGGAYVSNSVRTIRPIPNSAPQGRARRVMRCIEEPDVTSGASFGDADSGS